MSDFVNIGTVLMDHAVGGFPASAPGVVRSPLHAGRDVDAFGGIALTNRAAEVNELFEAVFCLDTASSITDHILKVDSGFVT